GRVRSNGTGRSPRQADVTARRSGSESRADPIPTSQQAAPGGFPINPPSNCLRIVVPETVPFGHLMVERKRYAQWVAARTVQTHCIPPALLCRRNWTMKLAWLL